MFMIGISEYVLLFDNNTNSKQEAVIYLYHRIPTFYYSFYVGNSSHFVIE